MSFSKFSFLTGRNTSKLLLTWTLDICFCLQLNIKSVGVRGVGAGQLFPCQIYCLCLIKESSGKNKAVMGQSAGLGPGRGIYSWYPLVSLANARGMQEARGPIPELKQLAGNSQDQMRASRHRCHRCSLGPDEVLQCREVRGGGRDKPWRLVKQRRRWEQGLGHSKEEIIGKGRRLKKVRLLSLCLKQDRERECRAFLKKVPSWKWPSFQEEGWGLWGLYLAEERDALRSF